MNVFKFFRKDEKKKINVYFLLSLVLLVFICIGATIGQIHLNQIARSGATLNQTISWNGSKWIPSTAAAGSQTPWISDINGGGFSLTNAVLSVDSATATQLSATYIVFNPSAITLSDTNAAMKSNLVSTLIVSTNVLYTNWPSMAVAGVWGRTIHTNSGAGNYSIYVPTNLMTANLTNATGSYVALDGTGTNWACLLTNGATAELTWYFWGGNISSGHAYFRHW